jgi:hypothetical protein
MDKKNASEISPNRTSLGFKLGIPSPKYSRGPRKSELGCGSPSLITPKEPGLELPSEPNSLESMGSGKKPKPM